MMVSSGCKVRAARWQRGSVSSCSLSSTDNEENERPELGEDGEHVPVGAAPFTSWAQLSPRKLSATVTIPLPQGPQKRNFPPPSRLARFRIARMSLPTITNSLGVEETLVFPRDVAWDWPFCNEGVARGVFTEEKFMICLPFNNGGTGEALGKTKKFEKISESNFSWTIGLGNSGEFGTGFWRMELEIIRNLNMLALIVSRDISCNDMGAKRLKRVRKVYRLPDHYDIRTLTTKNYDFAIIIEAFRRTSNRVRRSEAGRHQSLHRANSFY